MRQTHQYHEKILFHLEKVNDAPNTEAFKQLQVWQSNRLLKTHHDLYQQDLFRPAMNFFKDELYNPQYFLRRNKQLIRALPVMIKTMPTSILDIILAAAELHNISIEMDTQLLGHLSNTQDISSLTDEQWQAAYRSCHNQPLRCHQIDLIEFLGNELARIVKKPFIHTLLEISAFPAKIAGYHDIHRFVSNGFYAFDHLQDPQLFLVPVLQAERDLMARWFGNTDLAVTDP